MLVDSAPGGHHGVLHKDRSFAPRCRGRFGSALDLHGQGVGDYAIVPDYPKADHGQLSVSAWVRQVAANNGGFAGIVANWWDDKGLQSNAGQFFFGLRAEGDLVVAIHHDRDGAQLDVREGPEKPLRVGVWHHVAFVADGAMLRLYHNGVEVAAAPHRGIDRPTRPTELSIGCYLRELRLRPRTPTDGPVERQSRRNRRLQPRAHGRPSAAAVHGLGRRRRTPAPNRRLLTSKQGQRP